MPIRTKYYWHSEYCDPNHWNTRTPLQLGMPKFFHLYQALNDKKLRVFLRKLDGKVLDAGCGDGRFIAYADVGADFSKGMLRRAKRHDEDKNFVRASILYLPFKDKAFSGAFTIDVLLHIQPDKREDALKEIGRVADNLYNFLSEHRTITPFILELLKNVPLPFRRLWRIMPYMAVIFAFPVDRLRRLKIDSGPQLMRKLG